MSLTFSFFITRLCVLSFVYRAMFTLGLWPSFTFSIWRSRWTVTTQHWHMHWKRLAAKCVVSLIHQKSAAICISHPETVLATSEQQRFEHNSQRLPFTHVSVNFSLKVFAWMSAAEGGVNLASGLMSCAHTNSCYICTLGGNRKLRHEITSEMSEKSYCFRGNTAEMDFWKTSLQRGLLWWALDQS